MGMTIEQLADRIMVSGVATQADAAEMARRIFDDGLVSLAEADTLFDVNDAIGDSDPEWGQRFVTAIRDFLLTQHGPLNWVTPEESDWLMSRVMRDGVVKIGSEMDLLLSIVRHADGVPASLGRFLVKASCERIADIGKAMPDDIERVRGALFAQAGDGSVWVTAAEADHLFRANDAVAFAKNDPSWNDLFARAIANHLMARVHPDPMSQEDAMRRENWLRDTSVNPLRFFAGMAQSVANGSWFEKVTYDPAKAATARRIASETAAREAEQVTGGEENWLMKRLGWDNKISPAERALIEFLKREAPGISEGLAAVA